MSCQHVIPLLISSTASFSKRKDESESIVSMEDSIVVIINLSIPKEDGATVLVLSVREWFNHLAWSPPGKYESFLPPLNLLAHCPNMFPPSRTALKMADEWKRMWKVLAHKK